MKKIILCGMALLLSLGFAKAQQTPGAFANYAYDDFQTVASYSDPITTAGIYWYSGYADATPTDYTHGVRSVGKSVFKYTTATGYTTISADFGHTSATLATLFTLDLTNMADIFVDLKNTSTTKDLVLRVYLKDTLDNRLYIEPNYSDCAAAGTDYGYTIPNLMWADQNLVYPTPGDLNAVYPRKAFNGFVLEANTRNTYRIDLSSVAGSVGGLYTDYSTGSTVATNPITKTASASGFDITAVHVVEFQFNENAQFTLSDGAIDKGSYLYDATDIDAQSDWTGSIEFYNLKVGNILAVLPDSGTGTRTTTAITDAAINNSLKVFPNPAKEVLNVSFDATSNATVSLSDLAGHTVYSSSASAGTNNMTINTSSVPTGMYILNVATGNGVTARKVSIR